MNEVFSRAPKSNDTMERVGTLIHKLLEQYEQQAQAGRLIMTTQMLLAELQQQVSAAGQSRPNVSVMIPAVTVTADNSLPAEAPEPRYETRPSDVPAEQPLKAVEEQPVNRVAEQHSATPVEQYSAAPIEQRSAVAAEQYSAARAEQYAPVPAEQSAPAPVEPPVTFVQPPVEPPVERNTESGTATVIEPAARTEQPAPDQQPLPVPENNHARTPVMNIDAAFQAAAAAAASQQHLLRTQYYTPVTPVAPQPEVKQVTPQPDNVQETPAAHRSFPFDPLAEVPTLTQQARNGQTELNESIKDVSAGESLNERLRVEKLELGNMLQGSPIRDLRKAIGINDRYLFINELFRGDETMYERSLKTINGFSILPEAQYWIQRELKVKLGWNESSESVHHFDQLVKRRFS